MVGVSRLFRGCVRALHEDASHLRVLTGVRGWAALWVFMYHAWTYAKYPPLTLELFGWTLDLTPFFSMGIAGVTIFFVLSGFLLATPFAQWQAGLRQRPPLGRYYLRRVLRVFPAYYAQLAILLAVAAYLPGQPGVGDAGSLLRHLLMLFMPPPLGTLPMNGVWWTLPIEFGFYLVLPLFVLLLRPGRGPWLLLVCLAVMYVWRHGVVVHLADAPLPVRVSAAYQLPGSMDAFGMGMLAAVLHVNRATLPAWLLPPVRGTLLGVLGIVLIIVAIYWLPGRRAEYWSDHAIFYLWTPALSLGIAAVLLAGAAGNGVMQGLFGTRVMVFLGVVSYSVYLWHLPVLNWLVAASWYPALTGGRLAWILALALPPTLAIATLSYLAIERPFMRMRRGPRGA